MNILLINSDLESNRGDRAIAEGILKLARESFPEATVTAISLQDRRDSAWFGVPMLRQGVHSLAVRDFYGLLRQARRSDLVLWGGGELLKDYTNRLGLWYWAAKMWAVALVSRRVVGVFQGIGPTSGRSSRWLIARTVARTHRFVVRDEESRDKLVSWGVDPRKVIASFDSAVIPVGTDSDNVDARLSEIGLGPAAITSYAVVAPRNWFHYRKGGWLPFRWRVGNRANPRNDAYRRQLVTLVDMLNDRHGRVLLLPMHMTEDPEFCREIRLGTARPESVRVLDEDVFSPSDIRAILRRATIVVAFRLHSGIIATSAGTPTITYYYVDKGRLFARQTGLDRYSRPIERILSDDALEDFATMEDGLRLDTVIGHSLATRLDEMRAHVRAAFRDAVTP